MFQDSNRNKINMIGIYLILCYDINEEKAAKLMTITKSNIDDISKSGPISLSALTIRPGWVSIHKTIQFTGESVAALLIIALAWWQWWDLATNVSGSVWQFQGLTEYPSVYLIQFLESFFGIMCICWKWKCVAFWILEIDYIDRTTRVSMAITDLQFLVVATHAFKLKHHS